MAPVLVRNTAPVASGGVKLATSNQLHYVNANAGDIVMHGDQNVQNVLIGPSNVSGQSTLMLNSNVANVYTNLTVLGAVTTLNEIQIGVSAGAIATGALTGVYDFQNPARFNSTATFYGSNTVVASSNMNCTTSNLIISGGVTFTGSNAITIGQSNNRIYPLYVGATSVSNVSAYFEGDQCALSDRRFKTDIRPITDALSKVSLISGYTFSWLDRNPGIRSAGVIAQEIREVLPEVVRSDDDGKLNVSYDNLSALLIQAIKELSASRQVISFTTTTADEDFSVPLPPDHAWSAAFVSGGAQYTRSFAAVGAPDAATGAQTAHGRMEVPSTYQLLVL